MNTEETLQQTTQEIPPPHTLQEAPLQEAVLPAAPQQVPAEPPAIRLSSAPPPPGLTPPAPQPDKLIPPKGMETPPPERELSAHTQLHWHSILTGNPNHVPDIIKKKIGADDLTLSPEQRDYLICAAVNRSWVAEHRNYTHEQINAGWGSIRKSLAQELRVADDELEVFMALSAQHDEQKIRQAASSLYKHAYMAALHGEAAADTAAIRGGFIKEQQELLDVVEANAQADGSLTRERLWPLAQQLANGLDTYVAMEEDFISAPRVIAAMPDLLTAVDSVAELPLQDKQLVYYLTVRAYNAAHPNHESDLAKEGMLSKSVRSIRRGTASLGTSILQAASNLGIATLDNIGQKSGSTGLQETAQAWDARMRMLRELRHLTQKRIAPIVQPNSYAAERYILTAAEQVPAAIIACAGGAGFVTLTAAGAGDAVAEARLRSPETPQQYQLAAGVIGGAVQASIYMGVSRIGGRVLENSINNFMKARGGGAAAFSWAALNSMGGMTAEGVRMMLAAKAAAATDLATQELASRAASTASNIRWQEFGEQLTDVEANLRESAAILPYLLIGSGRVALRHFRDAEGLVGDGSRLARFGIEESKIEAIMSERHLDRKGVLLQEALQGSRWWSAPGFLPEAIRAMRLLNTDYFKGFERADVVRDFLRIPAESAIVQRHEPVQRSYEDMLHTPGHARDRAGFYTIRSNPRFKEALALWDEWWQRSNINTHSSRVQLGEWEIRHGAESARYERSARYLKELQQPGNKVPRRMQDLAIYAPRAEDERRALLRDRVAELQDLSYQFLMNTNPFDSILYKSYSVERIRNEAERSREEFLGAVGRTVVRAGLGYPKEENMALFSRYFQQYYLRKKYRERGARIKWLQDVPADYLYKMGEHAPYYKHPEYGTHPELLEAFRIYMGVRTNTELLIDLLPMMEDYRTALSRGMSPAQAYAHLIERELGYRPNKLKDYPQEELAHTANLTPMAEYSLLNAQMCRDYMRLTAATLEQEQGGDGRTYWRMKRPDGTYSRWHESAAFAMNDVAANASLTFLPLGQSWQQAQRGRTNLMQLPAAGAQEFSGYDQLCSFAMKDLSALWLESAAHLQPGLSAERFRHRFAAAKDYGDGLTPMYREDTEGEGRLAFDIHTTTTPYTMAGARFFTFWQRGLQSGELAAAQADNFLKTIGGEWAKLVPDATQEDAQTKRAEAMGLFSQYYFMSKLPELAVPNTVKEWLAYAAFTPPATELGEGSIRLGKNHSGIISGSNRHIAAYLRNMAPELEALRTRLGGGPLPDAQIDAMMQRAFGQDAAQSAEQLWCYRYCGEEALHAVAPAYWVLLREPQRGWQLMDAQEQHALREFLEPFIRQNPPPGIAPGEDGLLPALKHLGHSLSLHPELHSLSAGIAPGQLHRLFTPAMQEAVATPLPSQDFAEPLYSPLPFPYPRGVSMPGIRPAESPPGDAAYQYSLQLLDILRSYPAATPYALENGIWWNGQAFGGSQGKAPYGLEHHEVQPALGSVRRLLEQIHTLCQENRTNAVSICGVKMHNISPQALRHPALANITVYRETTEDSPMRNRAHLGRLMPGDPAADDSRARHPYVVEVRQGAYTDNELHLLRPGADMLSCQVPLQTYTHAPHRKYAENSRQETANSVLQHALDSLCSIAGKDAAFMVNRLCNKLSLPEVLMRLFEDTNFAYNLQRHSSVHELRPQTLKTLRLAADIIRCIAAPNHAGSKEAAQALRRLQQHLRRLNKEQAEREVIEHELMRSTPKILNNPISQ